METEKRISKPTAAVGRQYPISIFVLLFSLYLLTFSGRYHSSDEMSMLAVTDSLARRGAWDIELLRWMGQQQGSFGPDGTLYSRKGIGATLAALPLYWLAVQVRWIGNVQAAMLTNGVATALTGVLVFLFLRRLRYGKGVSLGVVLAFGLGTMAWPYARYLFSESLAGLGLLAAAYFLLRYRDEGDWASPMLAGAGLGVALLARLNNALAAPFLGLLLLVYLKTYSPSPRGGALAPSPFGGEGWGEGGIWLRTQILRPILLFALPVLAALAVIAWYNWLRFGHPLTTGYLPQERFATPFFEGFYGLTLSPGKGLFWYNPLFFAAVAAWPAFFRKYRAEALLVAAVVLGNVAFYAPWYLWWAGHAWGPRFLVAILPFAALPLAPALEAARRRRGLALGLAALALVSVGVQVLGVAVDFNRYLEDVHAELGLYHPATLFNPAYSPLLRQWTYLRVENLDLAWARLAAGSEQRAASAALVACCLLLAAILSLWAAWRGRLGKGLAAGLLLVLVGGALASLLFYAPAGDVAVAARHLAAMERPGEVAALTDPLLTEAWQGAYDGGLWVWGTEETGPVSEIGPVWTIGPGSPEPAVVRVQVGSVRLDYHSPAVEPFALDRLPVPPLEDQPRLGEFVALVAVQAEDREIRRGRALPMALHWRALAPTGTSYTVFVQLVDETGEKAGQVDCLPCNGGCPTTTWRPGDLVGEWYEVPIRPDAPPGDYQLIAGLYDLQTGKNLKSPDGRPYLTLGSVRVEP